MSYYYRFFSSLSTFETTICYKYAGMQGDHICSLTSQFIGDGLGENYAMALAFSGVRVDSAIMHGCRPASAYYTVTKADGPVILEIDHRPALAFMDELLGSAIRPEEYPFFLLFGINHGERWGEYDVTQYASRLCLGIDPERGGIVMFEPDMTEGTEFRLMFRAYDLDYMKPKIEALFENLIWGFTRESKSPPSPGGRVGWTGRGCFACFPRAKRLHRRACRLLSVKASPRGSL